MRQGWGAGTATNDAGGLPPGGSYFLGQPQLGPRDTDGPDGAAHQRILGALLNISPPCSKTCPTCSKIQDALLNRRRQFWPRGLHPRPITHCSVAAPIIAPLPTRSYGSSLHLNRFGQYKCLFIITAAAAPLNSRLTRKARSWPSDRDTCATC